MSKITINKLQSELDQLYSEVLDKQKLVDIFTTEELEKISAPHLLNIDSNYIDANIKILFVGKETNKWWGKLRHFIETDNSINILKQRYKAKFFGGDVPSSKDINKTKKYKAEKYNTPFFTEYKKVNHAICDAKPGAVIWSNLLKMDFDRNKGYSRNAKSNKNIVSLSKEIFLKEIEILKPDYIIFATSYTYDKAVIKEYFEDKITKSEVIETKSMWKFNIGDTICYRTWHPSTITYHAEKTKLEYYQDIIGYILNRTHK